MNQARGMRYYEAALEVLRSVQRPLTTREVTDQAIERGLITPGGKTPHLTMGAALYLGLRADPQLVKLEAPGNNNRAKHGSVRWTLDLVKPLSVKQSRGMTFYEAALEVLRSVQRPLTTREVTDQAIERGLITPGGKTPRMTMGTALYLGLRADPQLVKLEAPGNNNRAKHGSVRWTVRHVKSLPSPSDSAPDVAAPGPRQAKTRADSERARLRLDGAFLRRRASTAGTASL